MSEETKTETTEETKLTIGAGITEEASEESSESPDSEKTLGLPADWAKDPTLSKFKTVEDLGKSYKHLQSAQGKQLKDVTTREQLANYLKTNVFANQEFDYKFDDPDLAGHKDLLESVAKENSIHPDLAQNAFKKIFSELNSSTKAQSDKELKEYQEGLKGFIEKNPKIEENMLELGKVLGDQRESFEKYLKNKPDLQVLGILKKIADDVADVQNPAIRGELSKEEVFNNVQDIDNQIVALKGNINSAYFNSQDANHASVRKQVNDLLIKKSELLNHQKNSEKSGLFN